MSAESTRTAGQAAAERELMLDECTVTRPGEVGPVDPETGLPTTADPVQVYPVGDAVGACYLDMSARRVSSSDMQSVGADIVAVQRPSVGLPLAAPVLRVGDTVTVTASILSINVGRRFKVTGLPGGTLMVMARYSVEEIIS